MSILLAPVRFTPHIGGIETLLEHTLPLLRADGHEFVVVTGADDDHPTVETIDGVPVYRFPFERILFSAEPARLLATSARLQRIEQDHDVHLRHIHGFDFGLWFVVRQHRRRALPLVVSVHHTLEAHEPYSPVALDALRTADVVTAVSESVRSSVEATVPSLRRPVRVIPNGLAPRRDICWQPEPGRLFMAGRLHWMKAFDVAVHAVAELQERWPTVHLRIAGEGPDESRIRDAVEHGGVADRVELLGPCSHDQVNEEIQRASIVVVPSRAWEGQGLIALEAALLGRPVVATRVGGLPETVIDGVTGVLVPPDDHLALAAALDDLLASPQRVQRMGDAARHHAANFDAQHCAHAYASVYGELAHSRPASAATE